MNIYQPVSACRKCGFSAEHRTDYVEPVSVTLATGGSEEIAPEYLQRTCMRCGYQWKEAVHDGQPE